MNRLLLTLAAMLVLFAACTKPDSPLSAEEDLRDGTWRRSSGRVTYKDSLTRGDSTIVYDTLEPKCRQDNRLKFNVNLKGTMSLGPDFCTAGEADNKEFTWQIRDNEKRLSLYGVSDYFPTNDVDAEILTRALGTLTIQYRVIKLDPAFQTADTLIYTDILRRN